MDPYIRGEENYVVLNYLLELLVEFGFVTLNCIKRPGWLINSESYWLCAEDLGMSHIWADEWTKYIFDP